jgi:hypothetical protein
MRGELVVRCESRQCEPNRHQCSLWTDGMPTWRGREELEWFNRMIEYARDTQAAAA